MRFQSIPDLFALGLDANRLDKIFSDLVVDVCLEQRHPDLAQGRINVLGRQFALTTQISQRQLKFVGQRFEHIDTLRPQESKL